MAVKFFFGSYLRQKAISAHNSGCISAELVQEKHFEVSDTYRSLFCTKIGRHYVTKVGLRSLLTFQVNFDEDVMKKSEKRKMKTLQRQERLRRNSYNAFKL